MNKITFKGSPMTLAGRALKINAAAPDFRVTSQDLKEVRLADLGDRIKMVTSFVSLDTPVCDLQVKEFNKRAAGLSEDVTVVGISKDLPFAQKRFCESFGIKNIRLLSDYKESSFGVNYGFLIKELNLLARGAVILDKINTIRYIQIAGEATQAVDYDQILSRLEEVVREPAVYTDKEMAPRCKSCEGGIPALSKESVERLLAIHRGWTLVEDKKIIKELRFKDFKEAKYFLDLASVIAEEQGHHPIFSLNFNRLKITLTTHASGGLTENDFIMAKYLDEIESGSAQ